MATDKKISELPVATVPLSGTEKFEILQGGVNKQVDASDVGGGGGGTWGSITGTLSSQTDLQNALDAKAATTDVVGVQDLFIPASAMWPTITNGCATLAPTEMATSLANIQTLDFDQTTEEHAQFQIVLPRKWNNGTITFVAYWTATAGTPGQTVRWQMNGGAYSNDDPLTTAFGSFVAVDDTLIALNDVHVSPASAAVTLAGSPASADFIMLQVHRATASDDLAADAKLLGISIRLTTTSAVDA